MENIAGFPWRLYEAQSNREDNQQVVMYVRDINDDYIKLLQMAMSHTLDSVGIVSANVSQGICLSFAGKKEELEGREGQSIRLLYRDDQ